MNDSGYTDLETNDGWDIQADHVSSLSHLARTVLIDLHYHYSFISVVLQSSEGPSSWIKWTDWKCFYKIKSFGQKNTIFKLEINFLDGVNNGNNPRFDSHSNLQRINV